MICFRCGEKNPESYRFCGMCGSPLQNTKEPNRADGQGEPGGASADRRSTNFPFSRAEKINKVPTAQRTDPTAPVMEHPVATTPEVPRPEVEKKTISIGGPSLLGLNEPSLDSLREKAFSSAEETFEPEYRRPAWGRIFATLIILGAVGFAIYWRYSGRPLPDLAALKRPTATQQTATNGPPSGSDPVASPDKKDSTAPSSETSPASTNAAPAANDSSSTTPSKAESPSSAEKKPAETESAEPASTHAAAPQVDKTSPASAAPQPDSVAQAKPATTVIARNNTEPAKSSKPTPAAPADNGDALFKKGEAYLYGRGAPENCDQAVKLLKAASDKSHAKARSTFGTMYATGHCVPRDLPSSYRWFALALRVDPNNPILEKDLSAVWNQMTPPERQLAMKNQ